ncbi:phosphoenolpyruvate carboxykinase (ATP) [Bacteriovorax sp. Seq25_V]|uniref:phosphoenolpyruvate carboxykinase (ATP) n=1 Tax=Bacteriovorax sp. Seq25_V TaxID=1201288 RepID=UPI000389F061|nr:phosphoenolpyruvate carboxykinase (ATP) [Bacteriovorax sp. Seq25_V]EQC47455.1 phosphoenolpyruvate carboxykinase (ATP) [Bacteriovorax sp. Seq25_V]
MTSFYQSLGINLDRSPNNIYFNLSRAELVEQAVARGIGKLTKDGALVVKTGKYTGRAANDRYIVKSAATENTVWWENNLHPMTPETFAKLKSHVLNFLNDSKDLFVTERSVGADEVHNIGARLVTTHPNHALFSTHLFREKMRDFNNTDYTILHAPELKLDPKEFNLRDDVAVVTCLETNTTIICGTLYAGEIKKSMFAAMNYRLPEKNILPMHSGASRLENGEVSIFFGLSGTGKTTLSTDEGTFLIGDDEHGLSEAGTFNFEGGCYAKTYKLSAETEPEIYRASNKFGALLENVVMDENTRIVDFDDMTLAENGRSSYPLSFIEELEKSSRGNTPKHVFFLSADAFGVLPPVAKLTKEQAMFYFVLGYTAKLAGTEVGVKEPSATFSPCFGAPFMLRHPSEYAKLLGEYIDKLGFNVWLINTGWTGGSYGVGQRFPLKITRKIIRGIQANEVTNTPTEMDPIFGLQIPCELKDVPADILNPQMSWANQNDYVTKAQNLAASFHKQMEKFGDFYTENIKGAPTFKN